MYISGSDLLVALRPLVNDALGNRAAILALLEHASGAEAEVAREWLSAALAGEVTALIRSLDSRERLAAVEIMDAMFSRRRLASALRRLVRDPDKTVRQAARKVLFKARFADVALPDQRFIPTSRSFPRSPYVLGGHNASGWSAGLFANARMSSRHTLRDRLRERRSERRSKSEHGRVPNIADTDELAELLGIEGDIERFFRPGAGPGAAYVEFDVPKARGGMRRLAAPRAALKEVQRAILRHILNVLPVHPACHAYTPGRSLVSNALPHQRSAVIIKTDLYDFFPSIHYRRVFGLFTYYGYSTEVAAALAKLTTYQPLLADGTVVRPGVLPQGAPTSPAIANLICRQLDARLDGLARRLGGRYTRYADDITFSFDREPEDGIGHFFWWVDQICSQEGFIERADKRRVLRRHNRQHVTGVVVNSTMSVPRSARRRFRALLHALTTRGTNEEGRTAQELRAYLFGFAAYVKMVQPELGDRWMREVRALFDRPAP